MSDTHTDATWTGDPSQASSDTPKSFGTRDDQIAPSIASSSRSKTINTEDVDTTARPDVVSTSPSKADGKKVKKGKKDTKIKNHRSAQSAQSDPASGDEKKKKKKKTKKKKKPVAEDGETVTDEGTQMGTHGQTEVGSANEGGRGEFQDLDDPDDPDDPHYDSDAYWDFVFQSAAVGQITENGYEGPGSASDGEVSVGPDSVPFTGINETLRRANQRADRSDLRDFFEVLDATSGQQTELHFPQ